MGRKPPELDPALVRYFQGIAELRSGLTPWRAWVAANQEALVAGLGAERVLKLKFSPDKEIPRLLRDLGIRYRPDDLQEPLRFAASGLPWQPRLPKVDLTRAAALAASDAPDRGVQLAALVADARLCLELGREDLALGLAGAIAALVPDDATLPAVDEARSFLEGLQDE